MQVYVPAYPKNTADYSNHASKTNEQLCVDVSLKRPLFWRRNTSRKSQPSDLSYTLAHKQHGQITQLISQTTSQLVRRLV